MFIFCLFFFSPEVCHQTWQYPLRPHRRHPQPVRTTWWTPSRWTNRGINQQCHVNTYKRIWRTKRSARFLSVLATRARAVSPSQSVFRTSPIRTALRTTSSSDHRARLAAINSKASRRSLRLSSLLLLTIRSCKVWFLSLLYIVFYRFIYVFLIYYRNTSCYTQFKCTIETIHDK